MDSMSQYKWRAQTIPTLVWVYRAPEANDLYKCTLPNRHNSFNIEYISGWGTRALCDDVNLSIDGSTGSVRSYSESSSSVDSVDSGALCAACSCAIEERIGAQVCSCSTDGVSVCSYHTVTPLCAATNLVASHCSAIHTYHGTPQYRSQSPQNALEFSQLNFSGNKYSYSAGGGCVLNGKEEDGGALANNAVMRCDQQEDSAAVINDKVIIGLNGFVEGENSLRGPTKEVHGSTTEMERTECTNCPSAGATAAQMKSSGNLDKTGNSNTNKCTSITRTRNSGMRNQRAATVLSRAEKINNLTNGVDGATSCYLSTPRRPADFSLRKRSAHELSSRDRKQLQQNTLNIENNVSERSTSAPDLHETNLAKDSIFCDNKREVKKSVVLSESTSTDSSISDICEPVTHIQVPVYNRIISSHETITDGHDPHAGRELTETKCSVIRNNSQGRPDSNDCNFNISSGIIAQGGSNHTSSESGEMLPDVTNYSCTSKTDENQNDEKANCFPESKGKLQMRFSSGISGCKITNGDKSLGSLAGNHYVEPGNSKLDDGEACLSVGSGGSFKLEPTAGDRASGGLATESPQSCPSEVLLTVKDDKSTSTPLSYSADSPPPLSNSYLHLVNNNDISPHESTPQRITVTNYGSHQEQVLYPVADSNDSENKGSHEARDQTDDHERPGSASTDHIQRNIPTIDVSDSECEADNSDTCSPPLSPSSGSDGRHARFLTVPGTETAKQLMPKGRAGLATLDELREESEHGDGMQQLKGLTARLKLPTRRPSFVVWRDQVQNKPLLAHYRPPEDADLTWTPERKEGIDKALSWLRRELTEMRELDQSLARQLIRIRDDLHSLKLQRRVEETKEMLEDAADNEEHDELDDICDMPKDPFSPTLKQYGVTRMHFSARRFSVF